MLVAFLTQFFLSLIVVSLALCLDKEAAFLYAWKCIRTNESFIINTYQYYAAVYLNLTTISNNLIEIIVCVCICVLKRASCIEEYVLTQYIISSRPAGPDCSAALSSLTALVSV